VLFAAGATGIRCGLSEFGESRLDKWIARFFRMARRSYHCRAHDRLARNKLGVSTSPLILTEWTALSPVPPSLTQQSRFDTRHDAH